MTGEAPILSSPVGPRLTLDGGRELLYLGGTGYLGLNSDPALVETLIQASRRWGIGVGASRVTSGETGAYRRLERILEDLLSVESVLYTPTTSLAAQVALQVLAGEARCCLVDAAAHPALHAAAAASGLPVAHFDSPEDARRQVAALGGKHGPGVLMTDGVAAVDGRVLPLDRLWDGLADSGWHLLVDDAHGFGVLGEGRGVARHFGLGGERVVYLGSLSKALGCHGGFAAFGFDVGERARASVTLSSSTPLPPAITETTAAALEMGVREGSRRRTLAARWASLADGLHRLGLEFSASPMPIAAFSLGGRNANRRVARELMDRGIWIPFIQYPTPESAGVFRMVVTAAHEEGDVVRALDVLEQVL